MNNSAHPTAIAAGGQRRSPEKEGKSGSPRHLQRLLETLHLCNALDHSGVPVPYPICNLHNKGEQLDARQRLLSFLVQSCEILSVRLKSRAFSSVVLVGHLIKDRTVATRCMRPDGLLPILARRTRRSTRTACLCGLSCGFGCWNVIPCGVWVLVTHRGLCAQRSL